MAQPANVLGWTSRSIDYTYDPLYRLTAADYSSGEYFHYSYDVVGNRLSQETHLGSESYTYDAADRLTSLDGIPFTWDDNGNLLTDGEWSYSYDHADRLTELSAPGASYAFAYKGLGDRLQGTDGIDPVEFSLDLHAGLTQVLESGSDAYLYGLGRVGGETAGDRAYYLGDALGSVRGVSEADGGMALARWYTPFGETMTEAGQGKSAYGFAGEWQDPAGLLYLRARYYGASQGRFLTKDPFMGLLALPASLHAYSYAFNNPLLYTDPSGEFPLLAAAIAVGVGALIGGGMVYGRQVWNNHQNGLTGRDAWFNCIDFWEVGIGAISGGAAGLVGFMVPMLFPASATLGHAILLGSFVGSSSSFTGQLVHNILTPGKRWSEGLVASALMGGVSGGIAGGIGYGIRSFISNVVSSRRVQPDFYVRPNGDVIPATGYHHYSSGATFLDDLVSSGYVRPNSKGTYLTFDEYNSHIIASARLQVPHDAGIRVEVDMLQIIDDVRIPHGDWGNASYLEPITRDFPGHGIGGATQVITNQGFRVREIIDLLTGEVLNAFH